MLSGGYSMLRILSFTSLFVFAAFLFLTCQPKPNTDDFLTIEEREWLKNHEGSIRLAPDPGWPPVEFFDNDGCYSGIGADIVHELESILEFRFRILRLKNWAEVLKLAKERKVDVFGAATRTPERSKYMLFTKPFYENPSVLISGINSDVPSDLSLVKGERVIVGRGYANHEYLVKKYPHLNLIAVPTIELGLFKVALGEADMMVSDFATVAYLIEKENISNLRISGRIDHSMQLCLASRSDWPIFNSILEKGLLKISKKRRSEIVSSWIHLPEKSFFVDKTLLAWSAVFLLSLFIVFFFITLWNRSLKKQVVLRTEELGRSEQKFRRLIENAKDMIFRLDLVEGKYDYISPSVEGLTGYSSEDFYKNPSLLKDVIHKGSKDYFLDKMNDLNNGIIPFSYEYRIVCKDGSEKWLNQRNVKVYDDNGSLVALEGIVSDITERRRYEQEIKIRNEELAAANEEVEATNEEFEAMNEELVASHREIEDANQRLMESERKMSTLLGNLPGMAYRCLNDHDWTMEYLSEGCYSLTGYHPEEIMGNQEISYWDIIHPEDRDIVWNNVQDALGESTFFELRYRILTKSGEIRWAWEKGRGIFDNQGRVLALEGVINDITELEEKEEQLIQAQKMETIGNLAGGIAHDFNNVLGGITGSISILERIISREKIVEREKTDRYLEIAREAAGRAADLVTNLLTLSRKHDFDRVQVDLDESVRNVISLCENSFPKSVSFLYSPPCTQAIVCGDPVRLEQVILNLCVNASHSMTFMRDEETKPGGEILIDISFASSDSDFCIDHDEAFSEQGYWKIMVRDKGVGMDENIKQHLFDPFFSTKEKGMGSGLGLTMVHSIVRQHNGFIEVDSEKGVGTTICVYLPTIDFVDQVRSGEKTLFEDQGKGELVLVVDDESIMLSVAEGILLECGYRVILAKSGQEALSILDDMFSEIQLVLLDMSMPKMSGLETYAEIKKLYPDLIVLISSGFKQDERVQEVLDMGAAGFVQKPYSADALSSYIRKILDKEEPADSPEYK